ncbi:MAG: RNA polymerase subunit sigma-24 [Candidatus Chloroheliales bacterium]|nr:MAG: RNA polymerase subunit sigma-24 [Chloroflexota bacterium]
MDSAILEQARAGDAAAFAVIYETYNLAIHNYAYRLLGNQEQADDITQEAFIKAYQGIGSLRNEAGLQAWLYRIASNLCLDVLRRRKVVSWLPLREEGNGDTPPHGVHLDLAAPSADFAADLAEADAVHAVLAQLPPPLAACLVLRSVEGFSCDEIAEILKIPRGTVWSRLARARELFVAAYNRGGSAGGR